MPLNTNGKSPGCYGNVIAIWMKADRVNREEFSLRFYEHHAKRESAALEDLERDAATTRDERR